MIIPLKAMLIDLDIKPLPEKQTTTFSGAVGKFTFSSATIKTKMLGR